jgi:hypothetical protein
LTPTAVSERLQTDLAGIIPHRSRQFVLYMIHQNILDAHMVQMGQNRRVYDVSEEQYTQFVDTIKSTMARWERPFRPSWYQLYDAIVENQHRPSTDGTDRQGETHE